MLRMSLACGVIVAVFVSSASAREPTPIKLSLSPAKLPTPALRYQLLPDVRIGTSGDAAPLCRQASELLDKTLDKEKRELFGKWLELSLDKLPKEEIRKSLTQYEDAFRLLDKAARCDRCDWGLRERIIAKGIDASEADLFPMRDCALLLSVRARLEMADGQFDKAVRTMRTGFALARYTGETDALIPALYGLSVASAMERRLDEFVALPNAPNLYNALTDLPTPFISIRRGLQGERLMCLSTFPGLLEVAADLDAGNMTEQQIEACVKVLSRFQFNDDPNYKDRKKLVQLVQDKHEVAKKALIAAGRPRDKVEAMPHIQVALLHGMLEYDTLLDQTIVWHDLPYWETTARFIDLDAQNRKERKNDPNAPALAIAQQLFPGNERVAAHRAENDRKIALLRTIEALRCYAAIHDGKLPPTLAAVKEVPIPLDPMTGKVFEYQLDGNTATLRAPPPAKETPNGVNSVVYELRIRK